AVRQLHRRAKESSDSRLRAGRGDDRGDDVSRPGGHQVQGLAVSVRTVRERVVAGVFVDFEETIRQIAAREENTAAGAERLELRHGDQVAAGDGDRRIQRDDVPSLLRGEWTALG